MREFVRDDSAQSAIEYALMLSVAVAGLILLYGIAADMAAVLAAFADLLKPAPKDGGYLCCYNPFWPGTP
jgi:hypothetical protein